MFSHHAVKWALAVGVAAASLSGQASAQTFTQPAYNFGDIATFATTTTPTTGSYSKQLTFSLSSASDIRIDVRMVGSSYKYDGGTSYLSNPVFNLFDSTHTLIGTSAIDSTFAQGDGNSCFFTVCLFNQGVTLAQNLGAGSYSIEFSSFISGTRANTLYFGVSKNDAAVLNTYLSQVTPANAVPEASTMAMMALGLAGLGLVGARRQRRSV